ncbi:hypothetical protein U2261_10550 [Achromobacter xylosoxidans]|uniref:hypothetical protein n=1 Tax=Alcaligenes xylosoxydans xylosoxydans TaxID=85698 RepID=UPI002ACAA90E|nr:hypothetical protein [Achromobacter xylosoxidans]MDZ5615048.1 hypothetical protein [Achromobacter xylosoxidans]MDZ5625748.1 hypothetical protein [Achromobacter xylosoxidans]MDZ5685315.1 hypothetical protein [Achromobacter xylosoxidans]
MNDRELLELAAKAAGMENHHFRADLICEYRKGGFVSLVDWNPLSYDGDALRLAVRLRIDVSFVENQVDVYWFVPATGCTHFKSETINDAQDEREATRRAIVRAAAAIGKEM